MIEYIDCLRLTHKNSGELISCYKSCGDSCGCKEK